MCLYPYFYCGGRSLHDEMPNDAAFHLVFIVRKRRQLVELPIILLRLTGVLPTFKSNETIMHQSFVSPLGAWDIGTFSFSIFKAHQVAPLSVYIGI